MVFARQEFFSNVTSVIYNPEASSESFTYKFYNPSQKVLGKSMAEHLRIAICCWHNFCWEGNDMFGKATRNIPWKAGNEIQKSHKKIDALFEFASKLGVPFITFHDTDIVFEGNSVKDYLYNFQKVIDYMEEKIEETGVNILWGTANLCTHPRYQSGAATNPDPKVFAYAATQVKQALEATHKLKGENYVLWNGRDGYETLLNTNLKLEKDNYARFLSMVVEHKHKIGFSGELLIEPKPCEPTKHQYDYDTETVYGFLCQHNLEKEFRVNIEANHATLAGHSFIHEVDIACTLGCFGSIDINRGDPQNGWDTDQFPNSVEENSLVMYKILQNGGFGKGGFNFDSKLRRQSISLDDMFYGHIGGIDVLAKSLLVAENLINDNLLKVMKNNRYKNWNQTLGDDISQGKHSLETLSNYVENMPIINRKSDRQELFENIFTRAVHE